MPAAARYRYRGASTICDVSRKVSQVDSVRVTYLVAVPLRMTVVEGPDEPGGLPKRLGSAARVPETSSITVEGSVVTLRQSTTDIAPYMQQASPAELVVRVTAVSLADGVAESVEVAASVIDSLSFQLQAPIHVLQLEALDVTGPLKVGDERDFSVQPQARNNFAGLFFTGDADFQWLLDANTEARLLPPLPLDSRARLALWWYLKVLYTPYIVDQFLFLWTALEVLSPLQDDGIEAPYRAPCGHLVAQCPACSAPIARRVQGASLKATLVRVGVAEADAERLWRVRQVVHGANRFRSLDDVREIGSLVQMLRAAVLAVLKSEMGLTAWEPPTMKRADGPVIASMAMIGHRRIAPDDIALETLQTSLLIEES